MNNYLENCQDIKFGDYLLFQEDSKKGLSKPKLVIFLGDFVADQTIGFNYCKWINDWREEAKIQAHIHWSFEINILGHWKNKPSWKEILKAYRTKL